MKDHHQNIAQKELLELARKKVKKRRDFYIHSCIYAIGIAFWLLKKYAGLPLDFFTLKYINWFVMAIWSVAYVLQAVELLVSEVIFGKKWEARQLKEMMGQKTEKQKWE